MTIISDFVVDFVTDEFVINFIYGEFNPSLIGDLNLWLDAKDATTLETDGAAQFDAGNSEFLSLTDAASGGDLDFTASDSFSVAMWVYPDSDGTTRAFASKKSTLTNASDAGWAFYRLSNNTVVFLIADGTTRAFANLGTERNKQLECTLMAQKTPRPFLTAPLAMSGLWRIVLILIWGRSMVLQITMMVA